VSWTLSPGRTRPSPIQIVLIGNESVSNSSTGSSREHCHRYRHQVQGRRPKSPLDIADVRELARIAALASSVLVSLRQPGRSIYDSERTLRQWLSDDGIQSTTADLSPALVLLEATSKIGRGPEKGNSPRAGWLTGAAEAPVWTSASSGSDTVLTDELIGPVEATEVAPELTEENRVNALATAIIRAFAPGRGFQGNVSLCESEAVLRQWLQADNLVWDEVDLPAAFTRLETATMPGRRADS
jgi:hypothetical protein